MRLCVRSERSLEQSAVATRAYQSRKQLRVGASCPAHEAHHRVVRAPQIDLELGVQLMRACQVRIELERSTKRGFRAAQLLMPPRLEVLRHHVTNSPEPRPRRRVPRIILDAPLVQVASDTPLLCVEAELIGPKKIFVGSLAGRYVVVEHAAFAGREG